MFTRDDDALLLLDDTARDLESWRLYPNIIHTGLSSLMSSKADEIRGTIARLERNRVEETV